MSESIQQIVAERISYWRRQRGLSQQALAEKSGVPLGTIRGYEQGVRWISPENSIALSRALKVSVQELFAKKDEGISMDAALGRLFVLTKPVEQILGVSPEDFAEELFKKELKFEEALVGVEFGSNEVGNLTVFQPTVNLGTEFHAEKPGRGVKVMMEWRLRGSMQASIPDMSFIVHPSKVMCPSIANECDFGTPTRLQSMFVVPISWMRDYLLLLLAWKGHKTGLVYQLNPFVRTDLL